MKDLRLERLLLFSRSQKMAKMVRFHRDQTLIIGDNQLGKSRIIKSIYYSMGAAVRMGSEWERSSPTSILFADLNGEKYQFMRSGKSLAVFHGGPLNRTLKTTSITKEYSPFLAELLGFHLKLTDRETKTATPPPSYIFIQNYIDQNDGWTKLRKSFQGLQQFPQSDQPTLEYHLGIKAADYYLAKGEREVLRNNVSAAQAEIRIAKSAISKLKTRSGSSLIPIDYDEYNQETSELVVKISELTQKCDKLRSIIGREREALTSLLHQRSLLESTIKELKADGKSLSMLPELVECPTCGHEHENAFAERCKIARDQDSCQEILEEIVAHIEKQNEIISSHDTEHGDLRKDSEILRQKMNIKRSEFSMREIVQNAGERRAMELLQEEIDHHQAIIEGKETEVAALTKRMDQLTRKERSKEVIDHLKGLISDFTLDIGARTPQKFKGPLVHLGSDGSELPRQILAATVAYIATAEKYGDARRLPLVIDSPLQQEQDESSIIGILKFMSTKRVESQVILGTVSSKGISFPGGIIELTNDRHRLLNDAEYKENKSEIDEYFAAFTAGDANL